MRYDFDEIIDRRGSNSVKWDECADPEVIPMWVADMDFKAAPFILDAVRRRVDHGVFGYTHVPEKYYQSVIDWFWKRRGWKIEREWINYISGIVPALSVAVEALSQRGDNVVFQSPAYNCFFSSIRNTGRTILENKLIRRGDSFEIDFEDFERKCSDPRTSVFVLCNPHNPSGRVWTREELQRLGEICLRHGVTVVSDEIHCELEMPGQRYTPFASICEEFQQNSVIFNSPSKSFNIAGLEIANIIIADPVKRASVERVINWYEHCDVNPLGVEALMAAYTPEGEEWLRELNEYLWGNYCVLKEMVEGAGAGVELGADCGCAEASRVSVCKLEGTYLAWLDFSWYTSRGISTKELQERLIAEEKVWINSGTMYGDGNYMRINLACPRSVLREGVKRILRGVSRPPQDRPRM